MLSEVRKKDLEKQGYRIAGNHSAIKVCTWTKKAIRKEDVCYKQTFYGIQSHRCIQMTPSLEFCDQRCIWCWRDIEFTKPKWIGKGDSARDIVDNCIKQHIKYLEGFKGNEKADRKNLKEAFKPLHFAVSLSGEPTLYLKLPELIDEIKRRKMTAFLVTNGTNPSMLKKLLKHQPTQLYITLCAPDEEIYTASCSPLITDGWKKIQESLALMKKFNRSTIRLTLVKDENMLMPEKYAALIKRAQSTFVECKAYVWVGHSRKRLSLANMPRHYEIKLFAEEIAQHSGYKIIDEKEESRVVLLMKKDFKGRILTF